MARLPKKSKRTQNQELAAEAIKALCRGTREEFLTRHVDALYRKLTQNFRKFVRVEDIVYEAAKLAPGLVPSRKEVDAESKPVQSQKDGVEVDQGIFLAHALANAPTGMHLCHAMLLPRPESIDCTLKYLKDGFIDFGPARVERKGKAAFVSIQNPRFLNAEDDTTLDATETAADIAILDAATQICVLRGGAVDHPKYGGRRVFCSGINLTHIYHGKIPFLWYIRRDMGIVNKLMRGVAREDRNPDEIYGGTREKPWIAQVDAFAIGGGCQYLLAVDCVVAASNAYMTLPARKEGIIPGAANLRMTHFTGARVARQAVLMDRRIECDSAEGRMICDVVVPAEDVDSAVARAVEDFASSGVVSAAGNRRAFRVAEEPLDLFRRYMAVYCREQAYCHFSPALIANLEKHWNAAQRKL
ncbi:MAG TPA: enoyl-CoA hydratase/isomerase family protein [Pseudolabrys sp.]|nr:enoyl-CoA hydratase/isomerase family protein [Pseudolabrys sp.]